MRLPTETLLKRFPLAQRQLLAAFSGSIRADRRLLKQMMTADSHCYEGSQLVCNFKEISSRQRSDIGDLMDNAVALYGTSAFALILAGDSATSSRLFNAIAMLSIPVIISDGMQLPFASQLKWDSFSVTFPRSVLHGWEMKKLGNGSFSNVTLRASDNSSLFARLRTLRDRNGGTAFKAMQKELKSVRTRFLYSFAQKDKGVSGTQGGALETIQKDAFHGILAEIEHRKSYTKTCKWGAFTAPTAPLLGSSKSN